MRRLKNRLLNNQWANEEKKEEIKIYLETNKNGSMIQIYGTQKNIFKREIYSYTGLSQEIRKKS